MPPSPPKKKVDHCSGETPNSSVAKTRKSPLFPVRHELTARVKTHEQNQICVFCAVRTKCCSWRESHRKIIDLLLGDSYRTQPKYLATDHERMLQ
jgi:hypothetical protein